MGDALREDQLDLHVLLVDDEESFRLAVIKLLADTGCRVSGCGSAEEALVILAREPVDVALVDLRLPGMLGVELMTRIRSQWPETEVIVISAFASLETAIEAVRQNAFDYLLKPLRDLYSLIPTLRRVRDKQRFDRDQRRRMEELQRRTREVETVGHWGRRLSESLSLEYVLQTAVRGLADLFGDICSTLLLSDADGTLRCVARHPPGEPPAETIAAEDLSDPDTPEALAAEPAVERLVTTALGEPPDRILPLGMRNDRFGVLATGRIEAQRISEESALMFVAHVSSGIARALQYQRMSESTYRDGLTGLYNRVYVEERLVDEVARSRRYERPLSVLFIDIDRFKSINDECGHATGDRVLMALGELLSSKPSDGQTSNRASDISARWGGDEFIMVLPETDDRGARIKAEKICSGMAARQIEGVGGTVTVSIGVASFPSDAREAAALVDAADGALYVAKRGGRNQVATTPTSE